MKKLLFICFTFFVFGSECDLIVFSYNRPMQLYAFLESLDKNTSYLRKIACVLRADPPYEAGYSIVQNAFPRVHFIHQANTSNKTDFKPIVMDLLFGPFGEKADYILFAVDDIIITDEIDIKEGIAKLQNTGAYGLYYRLGKHTDYCYANNSYQGIPPLNDAGNGYFSWSFNAGNGDWAYPNTVDLTMYSKKDLSEIFRKISFNYPYDFEGNWASLADLSKFGLCYQRAKMINLPINIVSDSGWQNRAAHTFSTDKLNQLFIEGLKIDVTQFYQVVNPSAHVEYKLEFVQR